MNRLAAVRLLCTETATEKKTKNIRRRNRPMKKKMI